MEKTKHEGTEVTLGGKTYVVPRLTLGSLRKLSSKIAALDVGTAAEDASTSKWEKVTARVDNILPIVFAALSRNYPELKEEEWTESLDVSDLSALTSAYLAALRVIKGPAGEMPPVVEESPSTGEKPNGATSTGALPQ